MAKKKRTNELITNELKWYEDELREAMEYLTSIKLTEVTDRIISKVSSNGGVTQIPVTKEDIAEHKFRLLEKLPKIIAGVKELRGDEEDAKVAKGGADKPAWAEE